MKQQQSIVSKLCLVIISFMFILGCSNKEKEPETTISQEKITSEISSQVKNVSNKQDIIILHQAIDGEATVNPRGCSIIPAIDITIYQFPDEKSKIICQAQANLCCDVVGYELHTYPGKYPFEKDGQKGYLLSYRGEGYYSVLVDNKIKLLQFNDNKQKCHADFWLCVRNKDGFEGWTKFNNRDDWKHSKYHGIFFQKAYVKGANVNMRSEASTAGSIVGTFKKFEHVTVLESKQVEKKWWHKIVRENQEIGWTSGDFIKFFN